MEIYNKTYNESSTIEKIKNKNKSVHFMNRETRDRVFSLLQSQGMKLKKSSSKNQSIHPEYIEDYEGQIETSFGNSMYQTYFSTLYNITVVDFSF